MGDFVGGCACVGDGGWDTSAQPWKALAAGSADLFVETLNSLLASIPYDDYTRVARMAIKESGIPAREWLYRSNILAVLRG